MKSPQRRLSPQRRQQVRLAGTQRKVARKSAGLTPEEAARKARICVEYLAKVERGGAVSQVLARRLAALYRCRIEVFLPPSCWTGTAQTRGPQ